LGHRAGAIKGVQPGISRLIVEIFCPKPSAAGGAVGGNIPAGRRSRKVLINNFPDGSGKCFRIASLL